VLFVLFLATEIGPSDHIVKRSVVVVSQGNKQTMVERLSASQKTL
jgi:hypothetical protein